MRRIITMLIVVGLTGLLITALASFAKADTATPSLALLRGQHGCTDTNPEYTLSDVNALVSYNPGSLKFTSRHVMRASGNQWNDTYLVSGFNRGSSANVLCGHYGSQYAYQLPFPASAPVAITGSMSFKAYNFAGTIGWDIWLVRAGEQTRETTAWAMEADHRTVEIMVTPGHALGKVYTVNGRWHRIYIGGGSMRNVNLGKLIITAMRAARVNRSSYYLQAIDGGAEFTRGTFSLTGYDLRVKTSVTERRGAAATASYTARSRNGISVTVTRHVGVWVSRTATLPLQGHPLAVQRVTAARTAALRAQAAATALAWSRAASRARTDATDILYARTHPNSVLPNVVRKHLGTAITALRHKGFLRLTWPHGLKTSAVVTWEAGHPGHLTATQSHISLRAKRR